MRCTSFRAGTASLRSDVPFAELVSRLALYMTVMIGADINVLTFLNNI